MGGWGEEREREREGKMGQLLPNKKMRGAREKEREKNRGGD